MKWSSSFSAEYFEIFATDYFLEPDAELMCSGRGPDEDGPGTGARGTGAGHATMGGDGKQNKFLRKLS